MKKYNCYPGDKHNLLTVIKEVEPIVYTYERKRYVVRRLLCKCNCGTIREFPLLDVVRGKVKSCGCYQIEFMKTMKPALKHGMCFKKHRLYRIWQAMKSRCYIKNQTCYKYYGGRGIAVCEEWKHNFIEFYKWAIKNGYNDNLSIDRINCDGNYEPSNCRWTDIKTQANNKSNVRKYEYNGEQHTTAEWSELMNINYGALWVRLNVLGWPIERALTMPVRDDGKHLKKK